MHQILKTQLSENEVNIFQSEIKNTLNITGYTKNEWAKFEDVWVAKVDGEVAGVCVNIEINREWAEIAVLYVLDRYRGKGIGLGLFNTSFEYLKESGKKIYTTTRNPKVEKYMIGKKFSFVSFFALPLPILLFNLRFTCSIFRIREYFRKRMYKNDLEPFKYGALV